MKQTYFYGFKNKETGLFRKYYYTVRRTKKKAVFLTEKNAASALDMQEFAQDYEVIKMVKFEES